jgi:putative addiction module killer protein
VIEVRRYLTRSGKDVVGEWLAGLNDLAAKARIVARIDRISAGNFGDCKSLGNAIFEIRIDCGPGYRIYYATLGATCILLLCAGDKRKQSADIRRAQENFTDYKERMGLI